MLLARWPAVYLQLTPSTYGVDAGVFSQNYFIESFISIYIYSHPERDSDSLRDEFVKYVLDLYNVLDVD